MEVTSQLGAETTGKRADHGSDVFSITSITCITSIIR
jgi:hypothetical protein